MLVGAPAELVTVRNCGPEAWLPQALSVPASTWAPPRKFAPGVYLRYCCRLTALKEEDKFFNAVIPAAVGTQTKPLAFWPMVLGSKLRKKKSLSWRMGPRN